MTFFADPQRFRGERAKILYAASFFDGIALAWFEPFMFINEDQEEMCQETQTKQKEA